MSGVSRTVSGVGSVDGELGVLVDACRLQAGPRQHDLVVVACAAAAGRHQQRLTDSAPGHLPRRRRSRRLLLLLLLLMRCASRHLCPRRRLLCTENRRSLATLHALYTTTTGWLSSRVVSVLDSGAEGPGFKSQSRRCRVTVKLLPLFTKQQTVHTHRVSLHQAAKLVAALLRTAGMTAGLEESNSSLPSGL